MRSAELTFCSAQPVYDARTEAGQDSCVVCSTHSCLKKPSRIFGAFWVPGRPGPSPRGMISALVDKDREGARVLETAEGDAILDYLVDAGPWV